ncbi:FtsX-like permease family protein [Desulfogranum mediterraneum]|uniref:ABC transporter permease n=1 Tax=Desulfogranum mediterraneum TaxID=160661 RepID=UPI00040B3806|nr:ABC transporter permease [Desulfogranum mediterraneum]
MNAEHCPLHLPDGQPGRSFPLQLVWLARLPLILLWVILLSVLRAPAPAQAAESIAATGENDLGQELRRTVAQLAAAPERTTGSPGSLAAAQYIQARLEAAGPAELGVIDFGLPIRKHRGSSLRRGSQTVALSPLLYNAITPQDLPPEGLSGDLIYVGPGELSDFNGLEVKGAIVIMDFNSGRNWLNAASLGASALIYLAEEPPFRARFLEKEELSPIQFPCFWMSTAQLRAFLNPATGTALPRLTREVSLTSSIRWERGVGRNLYALFPGSDPRLKDQLLVVEAFYDGSSFIPGNSPAADQALSIAGLLELADRLRRHPPQRPFLLMATSGHSQSLAGMREMIWTAGVASKELRRQAKTLKRDAGSRSRYLEVLALFQAREPEPPDGLLFQEALAEVLKLEIDRLSSRLMELRLREGEQSPEEEIAALAQQRLELRQLSWRTDFSGLKAAELELLQPLCLSAQARHRRVLAEIREQQEMLRKNRALRSLLTDYEPRALVSLHLSSHGNGLGAFERGFMYPLRARINRTSAFREIDRVLQEVAAAAPPSAPVFISTLRPNRLQPWQDLLPDKPQLGGEVSCLAGLPGLTLATTGDLRSAWGTPADTVEQVDWPRAAAQWQLARELILGLDQAQDLPLGYIRDGFSTVSGKASLLLHGELFAEQPAPGTMLLAFQGPSRYHALSDQQGRFILKGMADKKHVQDKVIIEGYRFSRHDGRVRWAIDKKLTGKSSYRIKMQRRAMRTDLVMFPCEQLTLFNLLEPRSLRYMTKLQLIDGRREAPPLRYWYSRIDTRSSIIASLFLEPGTRLKLTLSDTILKKKMILTHGDPTTPMGSGYDLDTSPALHNTAYLTARDLWSLLGPRIENLEQHGIHNQRITTLQEQGLAALAQAEQALSKRSYATFYEAANTSWALADRVYDDVETTQKDVLFGVLFYIALFVPFAFCLERLLFGYVSIYKRILAFCLILLLLIAVIARVHPAFALAYSPTVVILAFFIIGLSLLVTMIIFFRFESEMTLLQRRASHKRPAEISTWKAFVAAFYLGVSNLRRRRLRTALTCLTLIILTFTIMSFTTVSTIRSQHKLSFDPQGSYQGILLKNIGWQSLPRESLSIFRALFEGTPLVGPRVWLAADEPSRAARIQVEVQEQPFLIQGLMGLSPREPLLSSLDTILLKGRWFTEEESNGVLIPAALAARLNIDPDQADQPPLKLWGIPLKVTGIYSEKLLAQRPDLDGERLTPAIFPAQGMREMSEVEKEALESGEDLHNVQGRYRHIGTDQILILPASTLLTLGGELKSVALRTREPVSNQILTTLTDRFNLTLFSSEPDGVFVYNASDSMSYSGMPNILIPLIISVLIVLNTMISSVYERKREIAVYTSVGLAPSHVAFLFIAEAMAFAVISVVLGYLLAQISAGFLADTPLWEGITVNYSSTAGVAAMILVMGVVLLSVIYPSRVAAEIAIPDVNKSWEMPTAQGDTLGVTLPFLMRYSEHPSICGFLYSYFQAHQDVSHGIFSTGPIEVVDATDMQAHNSRQLPMADGCLHLRAKVWLAPFDFGIMQWVDLQFCQAAEGKDFLEISVTMSRKSGEFTVWRRVNTAFVHTLRKQLLVWRSLEPEGHRHYAGLLPSNQSQAEEKRS